MPMQIHVAKADLALMPVDAIVNPANSLGIMGGGVGGAIRRRGGDKIQHEAMASAPIAVGAAVVTTAGRLHAKHVIHAVGPVWRGGGEGEAALLASAYRSALRLARDHGLRSVAFPAISTGIYDYPLDQATGVAVSTVREAASVSASLDRVIFACFSPDVVRAYRQAGIVA